jgi:hypothetical protein
VVKLGPRASGTTHGVKAVVDWLSELCLEKSDYNRAKWQDRSLALVWEDTGHRLKGFTDKITCS